MEKTFKQLCLYKFFFCSIVFPFRVHHDCQNDIIGSRKYTNEQSIELQNAMAIAVLQFQEMNNNKHGAHEAKIQMKQWLKEKSQETL